MKFQLKNFMKYDNKWWYKTNSAWNYDDDQGHIYESIYRGETITVGSKTILTMLSNNLEMHDVLPKFTGSKVPEQIFFINIKEIDLENTNKTLTALEIIEILVSKLGKQFPHDRIINDINFILSKEKQAEGMFDYSYRKSGSNSYTFNLTKKEVK